MKRFAKTIKIYLIEGDPNGRMTCELSNWTGKAYRIPRNKIKECTDRPELNSTGIYFLFGKGEESSLKDKVYIGEAENVFTRLNQHLKNDFWNEAIIFISKDENLNKAHIKFLENKVFNLAKDAARFDIENTTIPTRSSISEADEGEMEEFLENIKLLINTLGYKVMEPLRSRNENQSISDKDVYFIQATRGANATGQFTSDGFVVFKDSMAAIDLTPSFPTRTIRLREKLIVEKVLIVENENLKFTQDYLFSSPSTAATIVMGRSANGLTEWKTKEGRVLKSVENG